MHLRVNVACAKVERIEGSFEMITARAVTNLANLLQISAHLSTRKTVWALPKGKNALAELSAAQRTWQGEFRVERSVTDADSYIVVGTGIRARK